MPTRSTGIDVGLRTAKALRGYVKGNSFVVTDFAVATHHGKSVADGWRALEPGFKPGAARVGLTGRDVNVRYTRVPRLPDWQLHKLMRFEVGEVGGQSGSEVASDFNVLPEMPEIEGEDVVLLAMARESLLEQHMEGLESIGARLDSFAPNSVALYNAWLRYGVVMEDTVLVANVGHENLDVILARGTDLLFARNLSGGSKLFDDAIAQRFELGAERAEQIKIELADLTPGATFADANGEKASRALLAPAGQLLSLLQSTVMFCKSQVKLSGLRVDRVMLCGGGAALQGLDRYLAGGLGVPVERFDPFRVVDTSQLDAESAERLDEHQLEAVVALGLATMGSAPEAWSLEILPASTRRKREFWGGTAFLVAAAALAVLLLGTLAWQRRSELAEVEGTVSTLRTSWNRKKDVDQRTHALLAENAELAELARDLATLAGAGEQAHRVLVALDRSLPGDFWLTGFGGRWGFDAELGVARGDERPILHVEGRTREGTESVAVQFQDFVESLRARVPGAVMKESLSNTGARFTLDLTLLAPQVLEPTASAGDAADESGEEG